MGKRMGWGGCQKGNPHCDGNYNMPCPDGECSSEASSPSLPPIHSLRSYGVGRQDKGAATVQLVLDDPAEARAWAVYLADAGSDAHPTAPEREGGAS